MPRKNKESTTKKEEAPENSRRRSARLAAVEPKSKAKEESPVKTPKRQAAKRASHEVKKTMADEENVNSNIESIPSVEKVDQDGDKSSIDNKGVSEAKKPKIEDDDKSAKKSKDNVDEETSDLVIDTPNEKREINEETKVEEKNEAADKDVKSGEESGKGSEQNHVNNIESNDKVESLGS